MNTCKFDNCDTKVIARGWCNKHYQRWYKTGDPSISLFELQPHEPEQCSIENCDVTIKAKGLCIKHYRRWQRHGDPLVGRDYKTYPVLQYGGLHDQIRSERGTPSLCEHCNTTDSKFEWAFDWPNVLSEDTLFGGPYDSPYTLDIYKYIRLCVPCHAQFDSKAPYRKELIDA